VLVFDWVEKKKIEKKGKKIQDHMVHLQFKAPACILDIKLSPISNINYLITQCNI
jgi:hypothetical protein